LLDLLVRIKDQMPFGVDESNRWPHDQLAALGFVQDATLQSGPQNVQFGFTHGSLQSEQQAIIEVRGIIDAIFVQDEGVGKGAYFQQTMPVGGVACQPRNFQAEHDPRLAHADRRNQPLKTLSIRGSSRLAEISVDDHDMVLRPAQSNGALTKAILTLRAFGVFEHLAEGGLSHVEICISFQMTSSDFLMSVRAHEIILLERCSNIPASTTTTSARTSEGRGSSWLVQSSRFSGAV
jgi:hypothetical protein